MPGTYYAAVEGDPLTSGKGSRVFAKESAGTIADENGQPRRMAYIGDEAYCPECDSVGQIIGGAGVSEMHRFLDMVNGGRRQAVGGDMVLCKCPERPRVIARYGRSWIIHDRGDTAQQAARARVPAPQVVYDQQFTLIDAAGNALADTYYTVRLPSGELAHGITDSSGKTARYATEGAQDIRVYIGHREVIQ